MASLLGVALTAFGAVNNASVTPVTQVQDLQLTNTTGDVVYGRWFFRDGAARLELYDKDNATRFSIATNRNTKVTELLLHGQSSNQRIKLYAAPDNNKGELNIACERSGTAKLEFYLDGANDHDLTARLPDGSGIDDEQGGNWEP